MVKAYNPWVADGLSATQGEFFPGRLPEDELMELRLTDEAAAVLGTCTQQWHLNLGLETRCVFYHDCKALAKWLEEGTAEYFATSRIQNNQLDAGRIDRHTYPVWWMDEIATASDLQANLTNGSVMEAMKSVDSEPLWSILDQKGTQTMMRQVLGEAGSVTDFETVRKRLQASWYGMDFQHGVKFDLTISTGDSFAAATISSLLTAAVLVRKMSGSDAEKQALSATNIASDSGRMSIHFAATDADFNNLLHSPLFQSMVH